MCDFRHKWKTKKLQSDTHTVRHDTVNNKVPLVTSNITNYICVKKKKVGPHVVAQLWLREQIRCTESALWQHPTFSSGLEVDTCVPVF